MVITELHIENIKGLQNFELKQSIQPNRPNILVAPNGFGKTSLAIAFKSLKNSKLDLDESSYYNGDNSNKPILRLKLSTVGLISFEALAIVLPPYRLAVALDLS